MTGIGHYLRGYHRNAATIVRTELAAVVMPGKPAKCFAGTAAPIPASPAAALRD